METDDTVESREAVRCAIVGRGGAGELDIPVTEGSEVKFGASIGRGELAVLLAREDGKGDPVAVMVWFFDGATVRVGR